MARKPLQQFFELVILSVLDELPKNIEDIRRTVSDKIGRQVSWNTTAKYLLTLRDTARIEEVHTGKMVLYKIK